MKIYNIDKTTHEFISVTQANPDPMQPGKFLIPAYSTTIQNPKPKAGFTHTFDFTNEVWVEIEDHRGKTIWDTNSKEQSVVTDLGPISLLHTTIKPGLYDVWSNGAWHVDANLKAIAIKEEMISVLDSKMIEAKNILNGGEVTSALIERYKDKYAAAKQYITNQTGAEMLQAEADIRGVTVAALAATIVTKGDAYKVATMMYNSLMEAARVKITELIVANSLKDAEVLIAKIKTSSTTITSADMAKLLSPPY